jgi:DhnA family fructose-bisphosphate aldolase class Ia
VTNPADPKWITLHTRMALELGADAVKTDYSGDPQTMRSIVEGCPIPILVLGGAKQASERDALEVVRGAAMAGAAGVFFGRNVFQAPDMKAFLQEARAVLDQTEAAARR